MTLLKSGFRRRSFIIASLILVALGSLTHVIRSCSTIIQSTLLLKDFSPSIYSSSRVSTVFLDHNKPFAPTSGRVMMYSSVLHDNHFADATQIYHYMDSADADMEKRIFPEHDFDDDCVPMHEWQTTFHPTCNEFHQLDLEHIVTDDQLALLSTKGYWRYAWEYDEFGSTPLSNRSKNDSHETSVVFKNLKLQHSYEEAFYENNRVDAVAMERLTKSKYVVDIYGYCGMAVATEFAGKTISEVVDKLQPIEKLRLAQMVAQGVADVHGIDADDNQVSLVHNDLNFANIVIGEKDGVPRINDFNVAVLSMKNKDTGNTCPFTSHFPNPQWRAPEEQVDESTGLISSKLTEKVDIYALGNVFYRFAVGMSPWKKEMGRSLTKEEKLAIARAKLRDGALPHVPSKVRNDEDPAIQALLNLMKQCYQHKPEKRPTAQQVVKRLQDVINKLSDDPKQEQTIGPENKQEGRRRTLVNAM